MNDIDRAYAAGLFDGEGTIVCGFSTRRSGHVRSRFAIAIYNTNLSVLEWVAATFGGKARKVHRVQPAHWKAAWRWTCGEAAAGRFLSEVLPFLKIKKNQAQLALEFQATKLSASQGRRGGVPMAIIARRREIVTTIRALNGGRHA